MRSMVLFLAAFLVIGCGGGGGSDTTLPDVPADVLADADALPDVVGDGVTDTLGDVPVGDESPDVPADASPDVGPDAPADVPAEALPDVLPDAAFFHAVREHADRQVDETYQADEPMQYRTTDRLPDLDVRAIAAVGDSVWVGTPSGVYRWVADKDLFEKVTLPEDRRRGAVATPVVDLAASADGSLVAVAFADRIELVDMPGALLGTLGPLPVTFTSVAVDGDGMVVAGTTLGVYAGLMGGFGPVAGTDAWDVKDVAAAGTKHYALANGEVHSLGANTAGEVVTLSPTLGTPRRITAWPDGVVPVLAAACDNGLGMARGDQAAQVLVPGVGGLPAGDPIAVAGSGKVVLLGHGIGATYLFNLDYPGYAHYVSQRWIPDNRVAAVAMGSDGSRWLATSKGVTRVRDVPRTIADKEASTFDLWMQHFWRMDGFLMSDAFTDDEWNPKVWGQSDFDNDGLWTHMGIGALCYAYSVTQDEKYYEAAHKAMQNMYLQIDVPAVDFEKAGLGRGFVTRSLVREDEGALFTSKATQTNWHLVTYQGTQYYWKDDTSSDETTGHFFGYPLYYDLCARDDAERAAVADHAGALARYIVEGGYTLRDLDGIPTSFGHYEPTHISIAVDGLEECGNNGYSIEDCMGAMYGAGWLNGIEILGHLLSAWHMTGDRYFYDAYDKLITEYRYDEVAVTSRIAMTVVNRSMQNHSDHELAMLAYATLIRYEPNEDRRAKWIDSLEGLYEYEAAERQPLWAAIVSMAKGGVADVPAAVQTLREYPADLRDWPVDNRHRTDAVKDAKDRFGDDQWDRVFPYDEIRTMWWNGNPYEMVGGGSGRNHVSPTAFQLAYWAQRYAGILVEGGQ